MGLEKGPAKGGAFWVPILKPNPHGMAPNIGPKTVPGRFLIKPEALIRNTEYIVNARGLDVTFLAPRLDVVTLPA